MEHPRRSSQEWLELIHNCRTSSMTITAWCKANAIPKGSYESAVKRLVRQGLLPPSEKSRMASTQQAVCVSLLEHGQSFSDTRHDRAAVILEIYGSRLQILDHAAPETIRDTLTALRTLC